VPPPKPAFTSKPALTAPHIIDRTESEALYQEIRQCITDRAYQLYEESGRQNGNDERNWRQAEFDVLRRDIDVREAGTWLVLSAVLPDFLAGNVQIYVDSARVVVKAEMPPLIQVVTGNGAPGEERQKFFCVADLPVEVDPFTVTASLKDSKLSLMVKQRKESLTAVFASYWTR